MKDRIRSRKIIGYLVEIIIITFVFSVSFCYILCPAIKKWEELISKNIGIIILGFILVIISLVLLIWIIRKKLFKKLGWNLDETKII